MTEQEQLKTDLKRNIGKEIKIFLLAKIYLVPTVCYTLLGSGYEVVKRADQVLDLIVTQFYGNFIG